MPSDKAQIVIHFRGQPRLFLPEILDSSIRLKNSLANTSQACAQKRLGPVTVMLTAAWEVFSVPSSHAHSSKYRGFDNNT